MPVVSAYILSSEHTSLEVKKTVLKESKLQDVHIGQDFRHKWHETCSSFTTATCYRSRNRPDTIAQGKAAINIMIGIITKVLTGASSLSLVEAEEQEVQQAVEQSREASESARTTCAPVFGGNPYLNPCRTPKKNTLNSVPGSLRVCSFRCSELSDLSTLSECHLFVEKGSAYKCFGAK